MRKVIDYSLKCSWYCWVFIVLALLNFSPVANLLKYQIGTDLFLCLLYMSPIILLFVSQFLHTIGIGSSISIVLMSGYLIYHGLNITFEAWEVFKPVIMSWDLFYIWDTLLMQTIDDMVYLGSGLLSLVASVGGIIYLIKNKETFKLNLKARKRKPKIHKNPYGSAKLATPKDIKKFASKGKGIAIGLMLKYEVDTTDLEKSISILKKQKSGELITFPAHHAVVIAPTRAGKGIGIITTNLLLHDGGVFALDPKGELCCITKRYREEKGQTVFVFDAKNISGLANCQINLLDFLPKNDEELLCSEIQNLSKLLIPIPDDNDSTASHFARRARNYCNFILFFMFFSNCPKEDLTLAKVYDLATLDKAKAKEILKKSATSKVAGGALARAANSILSLGRDELSGTLGTLTNQLEFAAEHHNRKAMSKSTITKEDMCNDNVDIFICAELNEDGAADQVTQLLTRYIFKTIKEDRNNTRNKDRLMVLDELPALGYLGFVSQALVLGAGYGVKILAIFQSLEKLQNTYPEDWNTFLESSLSIFMKCKGEAAKYVSNEIGTTTINIESESSGTSEQSRQGQIQQNTSQQTGTTQSDTQRNLLTPNEISSFGSEIVIAFYDECPPVICKRLNYLENKQFRGMFDDNPLHSTASAKPVILDIDKPSNTNNQIETVENVSVDPPLEEKIIPINNPKTPAIDDSDNVTIEQFYFNSRLLIVELNSKKTLMVGVDEILGFISCNTENTEFINTSYIYENIHLSKSKDFFYWDNVDIKLDIRKLSNISDNSRYSLIRKMNSVGSRMY